MKVFIRAIIGVAVWMTAMYFYAVKISGSNAGVNMAVFFSSLVLFLIYILWAIGIVDLWRIRVHNEKLIAGGKTANAIITGCRQTGLKVTANASFPHYGVEIAVEVTAADGVKFSGKTTVLLPESQIARLKAGMPVQVYYDPAKKSRIAIDMA